MGMEKSSLMSREASNPDPTILLMECSIDADVFRSSRNSSRLDLILKIV